MKKKTLEERREELSQTIVALLKAKDRLFYLKVRFNDPNLLLSEEQQLEYWDLPIDIDVYCKRVTRLKSLVKKMEKENERNIDRRTGIQLSC